jgi:hypothetical protein
MSKPSFETIWQRIQTSEGEIFHTITGLDFTYEVDNAKFLPSRAKYQIAKSDFQFAYQKIPFSGPGVVNQDVRGPAYVWAVLHDQRIRLKDW